MSANFLSGLFKNWGWTIIREIWALFSASGSVFCVVVFLWHTFSVTSRQIYFVKNLICPHQLYKVAARKSSAGNLFGIFLLLATTKALICPLFCFVYSIFICVCICPCYLLLCRVCRKRSGWVEAHVCFTIITSPSVLPQDPQLPSPCFLLLCPTCHTLL